MEALEIITGMAIIIFGALGFFFVNKVYGKNNKNISKKSGISAISEMNFKQTIKEMQEMYETQITQLKKDRYRLQGALNRLGASSARSATDEDEEEESIDLDNYVFDKEMVRPMLNNWGMNADALDNPMLQSIILDKVKGNEELLITLGILRPKSGNQSELQQNNSESSQSIPNQALSQLNSWA